MKKHIDLLISRNMFALPVLTLIVLAGMGNAIAMQNDSSFSGKAKDAWIAGKLESAYIFNQHLNPFSIDVEVKNGNVTLSGTVESDIDRDLAGTIAEGLEGVNDVSNELEVGDEKNPQGESTTEKFTRLVNDATTVAVVKSKFMANEHIDGLDIDVDSDNGVVSLQGEVQSKEAKNLASIIAKYSDGVKEVENNLTVSN